MDITSIGQLGEVLKSLGLVGVCIVEGVAIIRLYRDAQEASRAAQEALAKQSADFLERLTKLTSECASAMNQSTATLQSLKEQLREYRGKGQ